MDVFFVFTTVVIAGWTVVYVLSPLLWPQPRPAAPDRDEALEELLRRRAEAYEAIRELESDAQLGKVDETTYAATRAELERRAVEALRSLDRWERDADALLARAKSDG